MNPGSNRQLIAAVRIHRALCRAYPRSFRERFADEMELDFEERCRDAEDAGGGRAVAALLLSEAYDLASNVPGVWVEASTADAARSVACALMLTGVPLLILTRLLVDPGAADRWNGLAALALHCAAACVFAIATRRQVRGALATAVATTIALGVVSLRTNAGTLHRAILGAFMIAVPVWIVLLLVNLAPIQSPVRTAGALWQRR